MRRVGIWALEVVLLVGLSPAFAVAAEKSARGKEAKPTAKESRDSRSWFQRWFLPGEKPVEPKPAARSDKEHADKPADAGMPAPGKNAAVAARAREEAALLRRLAVCNKLMQIALETRDEELQRQAEQLDQRAWAAYSQRVAHLPGGTLPLEREEKTLPNPSKPTAKESQLEEARSDAAGEKDFNGPVAAEEQNP